MFNFFQTEGVFIAGVIMLAVLIGINSYSPEQPATVVATSTVAHLPVASSTTTSQATTLAQTSNSVYASSTPSTAAATANQTMQTLTPPAPTPTPPLTTKPSVRGRGSENGDD